MHLRRPWKEKSLGNWESSFSKKHTTRQQANKEFNILLAGIASGFRYTKTAPTYYGGRCWFGKHLIIQAELELL